MISTLTFVDYEIRQSVLADVPTLAARERAARDANLPLTHSPGNEPAVLILPDRRPEVLPVQRPSRCAFRRGLEDALWQCHVGRG